MKSIEGHTEESLAAQDAYWHAKAAAGEPENVCSDYPKEPRSSFLKKAHKYAKAAGFQIKGLLLVRDAAALVKAIRNAAFASGIDAHGGYMLPEVTVAPAPELAPETMRAIGSAGISTKANNVLLQIKRFGSVAKADSNRLACAELVSAGMAREEKLEGCTILKEVHA